MAGLSILRLVASEASSFWSITSSRRWRKTSLEMSSGSPSLIRPWATASRLTSDAQITWPLTRATAVSPGSGGLSATLFWPHAASNKAQAMALIIPTRRKVLFKAKISGFAEAALARFFAKRKRLRRRKRSRPRKPRRDGH